MKRCKLKPVSKKRQPELAKYPLVKAAWRAKRIEADGWHRCEFVGEPFHGYGSFGHDHGGRCMFTAMAAPHHKKRRSGPLLNNPRYYMAVCAYHHSWIEDNKREARKRGYILYK